MAVSYKLKADIDAYPWEHKNNFCNVVMPKLANIM